MRQALTILWDSYRLLTAKKLFWISLSLSCLIALIYASISFTPNGVSVLFGLYHIDNPIITSESGMSDMIYMSIFTDYLMRWWLGWLALILALITVSPVFPDFLQSGSVDVAISKPISRVTLFLVKYLGCLLVVAIQVFAFCLIVFLALGLRIDSWNPEVFLAVPLLMAVFSFIFCVAVLVAVWTRSTLLSLLVALLVWGLTLVLQLAEASTYELAHSGELERAIAMESNHASSSVDIKSGILKMHQVVSNMSIPLPKTREATFLIKRALDITPEDDPYLADFKKRSERHSISYILGSSFAFEFVILGLACFIFVKKDY